MSGTWAIIVAGGSGERFGRAGGKQLAPAGERPLLATTAEVFEQAALIDAVVVVCPPGRTGEYADACGAGGLAKVAFVVDGGETRQGSVAAGLAAVPEEASIVAVHDGARPLVPPSVIDEAVDDLLAHPEADGVVVGHPVYDTVKRVGRDGATITETVDRSGLWVAQTPQVFRAPALRAALAEARAEGFTGTDDASLVERAGGVVRMLAGPRSNLKVTVPEDLAVVDAVLRARHDRRES